MIRSLLLNIDACDQRSDRRDGPGLLFLWERMAVVQPLPWAALHGSLGLGLGSYTEPPDRDCSEADSSLPEGLIGLLGRHMPEWFLYLALPGAVLLAVVVGLFYLMVRDAPIYDDVEVPGSEDQPDREPHQRDGPHEAGKNANNDNHERPAGRA